MAGEGVSFRVIDVDTFSRNEVVGRCFCSAKDMKQAMKSKTPIVMSLGDGYAASGTIANKRSASFASTI
eukprot:scaffold120802_cov69-Phaeocystis_antarctica.AAC.2